MTAVISNPNAIDPDCPWAGSSSDGYSLACLLGQCQCVRETVSLADCAVDDCVIFRRVSRRVAYVASINGDYVTIAYDSDETVVLLGTRTVERIRFGEAGCGCGCSNPYCQV